MAISRKPISIKDVAFRTRFGLRPEKTENQGPNRERKAGGWGESMVRRGALERCETGANPLETRGKRKPVTPENDPRETGLSFLNGGGGGNRTRVRKPSAGVSPCASFVFETSRWFCSRRRDRAALSCRDSPCSARRGVRLSCLNDV